MRTSLAAFFLLLITFSSAQKQIGTGQWRVHFPYNSPKGIAIANGFVYSWGEKGFTRYHRGSGEIEVLSKINGYSDFEVTAMEYNPKFGVLMIAYRNAKIDLLFDDGTLIAEMALYRYPMQGDKTINSIHFDDDFAFLSCGFGTLVYNLRKMESPASYQQLKNVKATVRVRDSIFAATNDGIHLSLGDINKTARTWSIFQSGFVSFMTRFEERIYVVLDSQVYTYNVNNGDYLQIHGKDNYSGLEIHGDKLVITKSSGFLIYDKTHKLDSMPFSGARLGMLDENEMMWVASYGVGLMSQRKGGGPFGFHSLPGPYAIPTGKMIGKNGSMWVTGGLVQDLGGPTYSMNGYYRFKEGNWFNSVPANVKGMDTIRDLHAIASHVNSDDVWIAGHYQGIARIRNDQLVEFYDSTNTNGLLQLNLSQYITDLKIDDQQNLWVANFNASNCVLVRTTGGQWGAMGGNYRAMDIVIDRNKRKWVRISGNGSYGIIVIDDKNTPLNNSDDADRMLGTGNGNGDLPDVEVNCLVMDNDGEIWVGTQKGLTRFTSPGNIMNPNFSGAKQIIIGEGDNIGYLMGEEPISALYVDGGNRKWIGSRSGLWLVSPNGDKIIAHYDEENSPLLSNNIKHLAMIEETGELFISTDRGLISFRTDASAGGNKHGEVKVFPNPVKPGYTGVITIQGLPSDAYVKITDIAGNLIFETRSNGGTATWDGNSFDGRRASSGVYLVFSANPDASDTFVSKIMFISR